MSNCNDVASLDAVCREIRYSLAEVSCKNKISHLASCLSAVELLVVLYWRHLNHNPKDDLSKDRDFFLLGKGHAVSVLYTVLAYRGFFPKSLLFEHGQDNSLFEEHPGVNSPAGVEMPSGSLGHALSLATGMALTAKIKQLKNRFYVLLGDGELNEGTNWEAIMFAAKHKLDNLVAIIDFNKLQGTGRSCEIMQLEPLEQKFLAFGWNVQRIEGHALDAINKAYASALVNKGGPTVIIADTIKGAGISFMADDNNWHYRIPNEDELKLIAEELHIP